LIYVKAQTEFSGVTICGAEFGENNLPGTLNADYIYPSDSEIHYFAGKGFSRIALPFKWERIQHTPGGELDSTELREIRSFIRRCDSAKIKVTLVMQNFGRYQSGNKELVLGTKKLTGVQLKDVWKKIADSLSGFTNIYGYDLMNEPHNLKNRAWFQAVQMTINGIRETDTTVTIIVDGNNYSYSGEWKAANDKLKNLIDPFDKILYDAHCYFDENHSGTYSKKEKIDKNSGTERVIPFIKWLQKNKKKGIIGEFGVPATDKKWLAELDIFLQYLSSHQIPWNYWAAGQWWKDYPLSIEPIKGVDQPQLAVLQKYLKASEMGTHPAMTLPKSENRNSVK
jgi:endoglucanase